MLCVTPCFDLLHKEENYTDFLVGMRFGNREIESRNEEGENWYCMLHIYSDVYSSELSDDSRYVSVESSFEGW